MIGDETQIMIRHDGVIYLLDRATVMSFEIQVQHNREEWTSWNDPPNSPPHREPLPDDVSLTLKLHGNNITIIADPMAGPNEIKAIIAEDVKLLTDGES